MVERATARPAACGRSTGVRPSAAWTHTSTCPVAMIRSVAGFGSLRWVVVRAVVLVDVRVVVAGVPLPVGSSESSAPRPSA